MKSIFKRSAIGLVVLGVASSAAMANHASNNVNNNAMWWPQVNGFFVGADGLYLRPQNGDQDYVTINPALVTDSYVTNAVNPNYQWGWRVYAGMTFADNDDLTFSWQHFNKSYSDSTLGSLTALSPRWLTTAILDDVIYDDVAATSSFDLDEAYLVWGHTVNFNNPWSLRFAGGVEYARLNHNLTVTADTDDVVPDEFMGSYEGTSNLKGWGPRLELDATYRLPYDLSWFLRTNAVLLSSSRQVSLTGLAIDPAVGTALVTPSSTFSTRHIIVPKFGMKVGLGWNYMFGQTGAEGCGGTVLGLELGWQADVYIHAIEHPVDGFALAAGGTVPTVATTMAETKTSNFSTQGLFIGAKIGGNWF